MIEVAIVGGGIAGLATALALKKVGVRTLVLERSSELRTSGAALSLSSNAWIALDELGVSHKLYPFYAVLTKGRITDINTKTAREVTYPTNQNNGGKGGIRTIHRRALLEALAEELPPDSIRFSSKAKYITQELGGAINVLELEDGTVIKAKVVIGCDGVHSVIARWLGLATPVHSGRYGIRGLAFYPHGHGLNLGYFRQFVCEGKRAGIIPLNDKETYWFLVFKSAGEGKDMPSDPESIQREVIENLAKDFPPMFLDMVKQANLSELTCAPLMLRVPWDLVLKNLRVGNVTVAGDAMHPTTPDLGQGGCMALEDAVVLGRHIGNCINQNGELVARLIGPAIDGYVKERKWRAAMIIAASFFSGWVQQDGSNWWMKFLRDDVFHKFLLSRAFRALKYDCGKLPNIPHDAVDKTSSKWD